MLTPMGVTWPDEWENPFINSIEETEEDVDAIREDADLLVVGGGDKELVGDTFSWDEDLYIISPRSGEVITVSASSATVYDGESLFVTVSSRPISSQTLTLQHGTPSDRNDIVVGHREGSEVSVKGTGGGGGGLWVEGAGTSSLLRKDAPGTAAGDYAINSGWGGSAAGDYSFQGGQDNIIGAGSHHTVALGGGASGSSLHNIIGNTYDSPQSLVIGENNTVDGDLLNRFGFNFVISKDADVDGDCNSVHGFYHTVDGGNCCVTGSTHDVDGNANRVHGLLHSVVGQGNAVFGREADVIADYCLVAGYQNGIYSNHCFTGGVSNFVGVTNASPYSIIWGNDNTVDADPTQLLGYNFVSGLSNDVDSDGAVVFGSANVVSANCLFGGAFGYSNILGSTVGGMFMYALGTSNTVDGYLDKGAYEGHNYVFGSGNAVEGTRIMVAGDSIDVISPAFYYSAFFGYGHTIGTTWPVESSIIAGSQHVVDGEETYAAGHAVFGLGHVVTNHCNLVTGEDHDVLDSYNVVGGYQNYVDGTGNCAIGNSLDLDGASASAAFGGSNTIEDLYSIISGYGNTIYLDSNYCAILGRSNSIGFQYASPHSAVFGYANGLDGDATNELGCNLVAGYYNSIAADYSVVAGYSNTLQSDYCVVFGASNVVGTTDDCHYSIVAGQSHTVNGPSGGGAWNIVAGYSHTVYGSAEAVFGYDNSVGSLGGGETYNVVGGSIQTVTGEWHAVFGYGHTVSNQSNAVFGSSQDVSGNGSVVGGESHIITDSGYGAIFGSNHEIGTTYASSKSLVCGGNNFLDGSSAEAGVNFLVGQACDVDGDFNAVVGFSHVVSANSNAVFGYDHSVTDAYNLVAGEIHDVAGTYSLVCGYDHTVSAASDYGAVMGREQTNYALYNILAGRAHIVYASYCAAFGYNHDILAGGGYSGAFGEGQYLEATHTFAAGSVNSISGTHSAAFGYFHDIDGEYSFAACYDHVVSANYSAAFGYQCTVSDEYSFAAGYSHSVAGVASAAFGWDHTLSSAADYSLVGGYSHSITNGYVFAAGKDHAISGVFSAAVGELNTVTASYSFVAGDSNTLTAGSHSAIFGDTNVVGATYGSPYSLVAGYGHAVDGSSYAEGYNCIVGNANNVDGDGNIVAGYSHDVVSFCGAVFGQDNTTSSGANRVLVFGELNDLASGAGYSLVGGYSNDVNNGYSIVNGNGSTLGTTYGSSYSLLIGNTTSVGGSASANGHNCVVAETSTVNGDHNAVFGDTNTVAASRCFVQGDTQVVSSDDSFAMGDTNTIYTNSDFSVALGYDVNVGLSVGGPYTFAMGYDIDYTGYNDGKLGYVGYSCLVGRLLTVDAAPYAYVFGRDISVSQGTNIFGGIVVGSGHVVGATNGAMFSAVFGSGHDVDGDATDYGCHLVAGRDHDVDALCGVALGRDNVLSGNYGFVHGYYCETAGTYGWATGYASKSRWFGQYAHSGYSPASGTPGESQNTLILSASCSHLGSPAAFVQLRPDGHSGTENLTMVVDTTYYYHFLVVARKKAQGATEQTKTWYGRFAAQRDSSASSLVGSTVTADFATSNGDEADWDFQVSVASDAIVFEGKGSADATNATYFQLYVYGPEVCTAN